MDSIQCDFLVKLEIGNFAKLTNQPKQLRNCTPMRFAASESQLEQLASDPPNFLKRTLIYLT
jgi:hypothetical protein